MRIVIIYLFYGAIDVKVMFTLLSLTAAALALAADPEIAITLRDHRFTPSEVAVPAGVKVKLVIDNQDDTADEFESFTLNREKVVFPKSKAIVFVGPLKPGRYEFIGEYHSATAKGALVAQ